MGEVPNDIIKIITEATDAACATAMRHYGMARASLKPDMTYVTVADKEIEKELRKELSGALPGSSVIGEEDGCGAADARSAASKGWAWVIDPIDGTSAFIDGLPTFCVSVALFENGRPVAGVLRLPATGDIYTALRGGGAFYNGAPIRAGVPLSRHDLPICVPSKVHLKYKITYAGKTRNMGSTALHFALVARGAAIAAVASAKIWDIAAAALILSEAGGRVASLDGSPVNWRSMLNNPELPAPPLLAASRSRWKSISALISSLK
jgi:fructose-1,6-bisphosphatase/inositol monophosphatase family enzyme